MRCTLVQRGSQAQISRIFDQAYPIAGTQATQVVDRVVIGMIVDDDDPSDLTQDTLKPLLES